MTRAATLAHRSQSPGRGALAVERVAGASALVTARAEPPLQLLAPRPRGPAAWVYAATLGGGLVDGDDIQLEVDVKAGAALLLATQASTKVYRGTSAQGLRARVRGDGLLAVLSDPVCPFEGARYRQTQRFELDGTARLVVVDTLLSGRAARGERWRFAGCRTTTELVVDGKLVARDAIDLTDGPLTRVGERMGRFEALAALWLWGPFAEAVVAAIERLPAERGAGLRAAAGRIAGGGALVRVAAERSQDAGDLVRRSLDFLPALVGADPFSRRP